jgi:hypothetical protein
VPGTDRVAVDHYLTVLSFALPIAVYLSMLSDGYATFALALSITWRMRDKQR